MSDTRRKRILDAVNHKQPDRVPLDFGGTTCTGIHCSLVAELREYYGLEKRLVKAFDTFQMLGWIDQDLMDAMELDAALVMPYSTAFGNTLEDWKEWRSPWGQEVLIPQSMEITVIQVHGFCF